MLRPYRQHKIKLTKKNVFCCTYRVVKGALLRVVMHGMWLFERGLVMVAKVQACCKVTSYLN